jgi:hypothetical protein
MPLAHQYIWTRTQLKCFYANLSSSMLWYERLFLRLGSCPP